MKRDPPGSPQAILHSAIHLPSISPYQFNRWRARSLRFRVAGFLEAVPVHHRIDHVRCWANSVHCRQCVSAVQFNHSARTLLSSLKMVRVTTESVLRAPSWLLINSFRARILGRRGTGPQRAVPVSKGRQLITFVLVYSYYH